jgi:molybdopterin-containing oxidoreductase family membrane subunit
MNAHGHIMPKPTDPLGNDRILIEPMLKSGPRFWFVVTALLSVVSLGVVAYSYQVTTGLGVTGLNRPVYWGIYIINFVNSIN